MQPCNISLGDYLFNVWILLDQKVLAIREQNVINCINPLYHKIKSIVYSKILIGLRIFLILLLIAGDSLEKFPVSRNCQLGPHHKKSDSLKPLSMSQLKQWKHFSGDQLNLKDPFLDRIRENVSFFFQNITNQNTAALLWKVTSWHSLAPPL